MSFSEQDMQVVGYWVKLLYLSMGSESTEAGPFQGGGKVKQVTAGA